MGGAACGVLVIAVTRAKNAYFSTRQASWVRGCAISSGCVRQRTDCAERLPLIWSGILDLRHEASSTGIEDCV